MVVMIMPNSTTPKPSSILRQIQSDYPEIKFVEATQFSWHAGSQLVSYKTLNADDIPGIWALLHELGHALLGHTDFETDIELLKIEVDAWRRAHKIAAKYEVKIDEDYIQNCLDSYRDWLHLRSTCPTCYERSPQIDKRTYRCLNCRTEWHVSRSRLCRPYRRQNKSSVKQTTV